VPPKYRNISMVFQNYALYPHMTVFENIAFPLKAKKMSKEEIEKKVLEVTKKLMIDKLLDRKPMQISGGQQQRVALARALVKEPAVLLFDEPLSNLDAKLRMMMRAEIKKLQSDLGITSVYVTHDQAEAMTMASRIAVFSMGKLVQYGTSDEIYNEPKNMFVAAFIGNPPMNFMENFKVQSKDGELFATRGDIMVKLPPKAKEVKFEKTEGLVLGFRPEHCKIAKKEVENSIPANVYVLEPLGRDLIVNLKVKGVGGESELIKIFAEPGMNFEIEEKVYIIPDPEKLHLFDPETEETIL
ncbi:MAG: ABC transporter ATP-binding protein, partial [Thermotogae bacterium]|nr:ABC transporter ATP-binding protein [Thermotogota bacterium]